MQKLGAVFAPDRKEVQGLTNLFALIAVATQPFVWCFIFFKACPLSHLFIKGPCRKSGRGWAQGKMTQESESQDPAASLTTATGLSFSTDLGPEGGGEAVQVRPEIPAEGTSFPLTVDWASQPSQMGCRCELRVAREAREIDRTRPLAWNVSPKPRSRDAPGA